MSRRFRRWLSWRWAALATFLGIVLGRVVFLDGSKSTALPFSGECQVHDVLDGETLVVRRDDVDETVTVRLLGLSVPAAVASEAAEFTRQKLTDAKISLTLDKRRVDSQGRTLAYVHVAGQCFNVELVRHGLANVAPYPGDSAAVLRELYRAQDAAQQNRVGWWKQGGRPKNVTYLPSDADPASQLAE